MPAVTDAAPSGAPAADADASAGSLTVPPAVADTKSPKAKAPSKPRAPRAPREQKAATDGKKAATARTPRTKAPAPAAPPVDAAPSVAVAPPVVAAAPVTAGTASAANALSVLMVTPEAHPFAKTGGLAEVTAALADALGRLGHSVTLVLPRYKAIDISGLDRIQTRIGLGGRVQPIAFVERRLSDRVTAVFVDVPELFDREGLYGNADGDYADNAWRFAVLSRAALEYARLKEWRPSIIHAHDWQTGLVPVYQKMLFSNDPYVGGVPAVFTLHNLAFQGLFPPSTLAAIGLGPEVYDVQAMEYWGNIGYLKGGVNFSEKITTVSPGYAREIVRTDLGFGLEGVLARRADDLVGILNGIDTDRWTPESDPFVSARFSADDLAGKRDAKRLLLEAAGLPRDERAMARPVIGLISRLTEQKGFDLIGAAAEQLMALDAAWVMLGSGERRFEDLWRGLAARYPDRVSTTIGFDERLAHLIEAGADLFLMPSRFEPCGLNQMYSLRYGTVPVVRATGGLDDTVTDNSVAGKGTGFKFSDYTPAALVDTVRRALASYEAGEWPAIQARGMREDHSWDASAAEYVKLYDSAGRGQSAADGQTP